MIKNFKIILIVVLFLVISNTIHTSATTNKTSKQTLDTDSTINNLDVKMHIFSNKIENDFLKYNNDLSNSYIDKMDKIENKVDGRINIFLAVIAIIFVLLGFVGITSFKDLFNNSKTKLMESETKLFEFNKRIDLAMINFKNYENSIKEKEKELHEKYGGFLTQKDGNYEYSRLDKAKFLEYDHLLYFYRIYLPVTIDYKLYQESLLKLGRFFVWDRDFGRAILRFKEIININKERLNVTDENFLEEKTAIFYNFFGTAYLMYVFNSEDRNNEESKKFTDTAIEYLIKSIAIDPTLTSSFFGLGQAYSLSYKKNDTEAIKYYKQVFDKDPYYLRKTYVHVYWAANRNLACCNARLNNNVNEIITPLRNIPENIPYWKEIIEDHMLEKIKGTPEWSTLIKEKYTH